MNNVYRDDKRGLEAFLIPNDNEGKGSVVIVKTPLPGVPVCGGIDVHSINIDLETLTLICNKAKVTKAMLDKRNEEKPKPMYQEPKPLK